MNKKSRTLLLALAEVIVCFLICWYILGHRAGNSSFWYGDGDVLAPHRGDFSAQVDPAVYDTLGKDADVLKVYRSLSNTKWFLEDITDFSQVVENWAYYVLPESSREYQTYRINENGVLISIGGATTQNQTLPYGLHGLTHELIQEALHDVDYEDYIITDSAAVIVWVRRESEDLFLTYPTRPDLMGIEAGKVYTLHELKEALATAYRSDQG